MTTIGVISEDRRGFTLVELAVVVVILGVLAAFGVPRFLKSAERTKVAEAFVYLAAVRSAQDRYQAAHGTYADALAKLELRASTPKYFSIGGVTVDPTRTIQFGWALTLTRVGATDGYGPYRVTYNERGYDAANSTIPAPINPVGR